MIIYIQLLSVHQFKLIEDDDDNRSHMNIFLQWFNTVNLRLKKSALIEFYIFIFLCKRKCFIRHLSKKLLCFAFDYSSPVLLLRTAITLPFYLFPSIITIVIAFLSIFGWYFAMILLIPELCSGLLLVSYVSHSGISLLLNHISGYFSNNFDYCYLKNCHTTNFNFFQLSSLCWMDFKTNSLTNFFISILFLHSSSFCNGCAK